MNYWLLTSEFPPIYGGGISTYCLETARMFAERGHSILVITPDNSCSDLQFKKFETYNICYFNPHEYYTSVFLGSEANLSYAFAEVVKKLMDLKGLPDVVESQEYLGIAYYLLQYKHLGYPYFKDLRVVLTLHAPSFLYHEYNQINTWKLPYFWVGEMERFCIRATDLLLSPSDYLVKEIEKRVETVDLTFHVLRNPYTIDPHPRKKDFVKNKVVFFGKLSPQKGCLQLLQDFRHVWNQQPAVSLHMIGGGHHLYHPEGIDMIDYIRKYYKHELETRQLVLHGSIPPDQINKHLENAHVVVIPSLVDNLPYTVLETMGRKKIVLASQQGGHAEIIQPGINGFLFDHATKGSFKKELLSILERPTEELERISENAFQSIVRTFAHEKIYEEKQKQIHTLFKFPTRSCFPLIRPSVNTQRIPEASEYITPLLSVIIPYYNMGDFVAESLKSVTESDYKNIEIIVVNDGSNQENSERLTKLATSYTFSRVDKPNEGLAEARNTGAQAARGEILAFLDPDDTVEPSYYTKAIQVLTQQKNIFFVGCWARYFGENKGYWPAFNPEPPFLLVHNMINSSAIVCRKDAFLKAGLNDPKMIYGMEDYESIIHMVKKGYAGAVLPEPLWNYRIRKNSMARTFTKNKQLYLYQLISAKHSDFYATFAAETNNLLNANGPGINYDNPTLWYEILGNDRLKKWISPMLIQQIKTNPLLRKLAIYIKRIIDTR